MRPSASQLPRRAGHEWLHGVEEPRKRRSLGILCQEPDKREGMGIVPTEADVSAEVAERLKLQERHGIGLVVEKLHLGAGGNRRLISLRNGPLKASYQYESSSPLCFQAFRGPPTHSL